MLNKRVKEIKEKLEEDLPSEIVIEDEVYYRVTSKGITNTDIYIDYRRNDYDDLFLMFCIDVKNKKVKFYPQKLIRVDIDKYFRIVEKYRTISKEIEGVLKRSGLIIWELKGSDYSNNAPFSIWYSNIGIYN